MADDPLTRSRSSAVTNEIDANSAGKARLTFDDVPHSLEGLKKLLVKQSLINIGSFDLLFYFHKHF